MHDETVEELDTAELAPADMDILEALLDAIIPPSDDGRLPGAGQLGVGERIAAEMRNDASLRSLVVEGLASIDGKARSVGARSFAVLDAERRAEIVDRVRAENPRFFEGVVFHVCRGYYQHPRVIAAIGREARPPYPQGFEVAATDPALLEPVHRRQPMYRKC